MSPQRVEIYPQPFKSLATSGAGSLQRARMWAIIHISGALSSQGTTSSEIPSQGSVDPLALEQTSTGLAELTSPEVAIAELRRRSGLTWEQLARVFGVARRSVHFWASGKALNATNEERLGRLLAVIRRIDRGNAPQTRAMLMTALDDGTIPFDLLVTGQLDELVDRVGGGRREVVRVLPPLSAAARSARTPLRPEERVGALHDTVHHEVGRARVAKTVKVRNKR